MVVQAGRGGCPWCEGAAARLSKALLLAAVQIARRTGCLARSYPE